MFVPSPLLAIEKGSNVRKSGNKQIKGPLGCLVSVKKRLKYTLLNSYYKSKCFARPQKACMSFTLKIFTGSSLKTFAPLKKIGVLGKFTISGDRESRDGGTFCWYNI